VSYSTLLVHLDAAGPNRNVLVAAASLAQQNDARIIGVAACQPIQIGMDAADATGAIFTLERELAEQALQAVEAEFRACAAIQPFVLEWRPISTMDPVSHVVAQEARSADLLIASARFGPANNAARHADAGELILHAGRPVLMVPDSPSTSRFNTVVIAWAETRECRRAVVDALPILKRAERVVVVEVASAPADTQFQSQDVVAWLARHRVNADQIIAQPSGSTAASLALIAGEQDADLIVAGAYGHTRLREWTFGGVTRDLLLRDNRCALLSH
jgi:nucleotide-binding universal stress UspA family protein